MQADLQDTSDFHDAIVTEGGKALVGYEREKALANMVLLAEIPTTYDQTVLAGRRAEVYPEDIQELARYVLGHRIWLAPHAGSRNIRVDMVIEEVLDTVPIP